jgi:hypothetical protein
MILIKNSYFLIYMSRQLNLKIIYNLTNNSRNQSWFVIHILFSLQHLNSYFYWSQHTLSSQVTGNLFKFFFIAREEFKYNLTPSFIISRSSCLVAFNNYITCSLITFILQIFRVNKKLLISYHNRCNSIHLIF